MEKRENTCGFWFICSRVALLRSVFCEELGFFVSRETILLLCEFLLVFYKKGENFDWSWVLRAFFSCVVAFLCDNWEKCEYFLCCWVLLGWLKMYFVCLLGINLCVSRETYKISCFGDGWSSRNAGNNRFFTVLFCFSCFCGKNEDKSPGVR